MNPQTSTLSEERENPLHSYLKGTVRKTQANLAGLAQGGGEATGKTDSTAYTQDNAAVVGFTSSDVSGSFAVTSGGSGFVDTIYGGANANGGSSISGSSNGKVDGYESGYGAVTSSGTSTASGDGNAMGSFGPLESPGATQASGSGTGSLDVSGSGISGPAVDGDSVNPGQPYKAAYSTAGGTAKTAAGGSATAFNMLASTGGLGFGMATGTATGVLDSRSIYGVESDSTATGTFDGSGFGSYGNTPSQPYTGGFVKGKGGGGGTAIVKGAVVGSGSQNLYGEYVNTNGEAAFNSDGGGSGFVKGKNSGASGSASGGASGTATGIATDLPPTYKTFGDLDFSVASAANGIGAFFGGYSTPELPGPTGGTGSGSGGLSILANSGSGIYNDGVASSSGSAESFGSGEANASNLFGAAGGFGSGSTAGSAFSDITLLSGVGAGTGTSLGTFAGSGGGSVFLQPKLP
jgi:hypothetical protein